MTHEIDEGDRLRKRLQLATEVTQVGCWGLDPESGAVDVDPRSRELFGLGEEGPETVEALIAHLHADDRQRVREGIGRMLGSGRAFMDDCRAARPRDGGFRWIAIAADTHQGERAPGPRVLGIVHDISDRKRSEEEHVRLAEELSRAVHVSEMFVGILSRDLRNPLSAILAGAQILGKDLADQKAARVLARVIANGERMSRMLDQLLDFTRARLGDGIPLERDRVDLAQLAREVVEAGRAAHPASRVEVTAQGDTVGAWDRDRVCQVLSSVVGNALQHGDASGAVEVVLDGSDPARVVLSVQNQGAIPADLLSVLFSPFRGPLLKPVNATHSQGLGLGLYVAGQIARAHGGELAVAGTATSTVFTLRLPRSPSAVVRPKQDQLREEELAAFERMAAPLDISVVTAELFGATPLHDRAPLDHSDIVERYGVLLDTALNRKAYRGDGEGLADDLRALAERLGDLGAGPREVTEVHALALRNAVRGVTAAKTQALLAEGRLLALQLMGNLTSYYRRRSRGQVRTVGART